MDREREHWYQQQAEWFRQIYYAAPGVPRGPLQHSGWVETDATEHPAWHVFLGLIDQPGNILDLGCGNGMLLRALVDHSPHALTPYGVDFLVESVDEAQTLILPEFRDNLYADNVAQFDYKGRMYTYIITSPAYVHPDVIEPFLAECFQHVEPNGGKLILYEYSATAILPRYQTLIAPSGQVLQGQLVNSSMVRLVYFRRSA